MFLVFCLAFPCFCVLSPVSAQARGRVLLLLAVKCGAASECQSVPHFEAMPWHGVLLPRRYLARPLVEERLPQYPKLQAIVKGISSQVSLNDRGFYSDDTAPY